MSGCERGWSGFPHCVYSSQPHQPQWSHHHHSTTVDYCGVVPQPPTSAQHHYLSYNDPSGYVGNVFPSCPPHYWDGDNLVDAYGRVVKRRSSANKKERRRTQSINNAFAELRECIPNVPADTKLSKIKTLRLATSYIAYLMGVLRADAHDTPTEAFKAELPPKPKSRPEHDKEESDMEDESPPASTSPPSSSIPIIIPSSLPIISSSSIPYVSSSLPSSPVNYSSNSCLLSSSSSPLQTTVSDSKNNNDNGTGWIEKKSTDNRTGWPEKLWSQQLQ